MVPVLAEEAEEPLRKTLSHEPALCNHERRVPRAAAAGVDVDAPGVGADAGAARTGVDTVLGVDGDTGAGEGDDAGALAKTTGLESTGVFAFTSALAGA